MKEINKEVRMAVLEAFEACLDAQLRAIRKLKLQATENIPVKRISQPNMVYEILHNENRPMHINEIIQNIHKTYGKELDRDSLVSALTKKANRSKRFLKVAANTFSLLEFGPEMNNEYINYLNARENNLNAGIDISKEFLNYLNARENNLNININRRRQEYE